MNNILPILTSKGEVKDGVVIEALPYCKKIVIKNPA